MAGGASSDDEDLISGINVTPLVDIMLCLLVIFMVTTSYVVADSIKMDLPEASTGESTEPTTVMLTYAIDPESKARKLYLNGEPTTEEKVRVHIKEVVAKEKRAKGKVTAQAVIAADKAVSHGEVIHLIDLVKQEGILKFALNIQSGA